jgi:hypothetical protein
MLPASRLNVKRKVKVISRHDLRAFGSNKGEELQSFLNFKLDGYGC